MRDTFRQRIKTRFPVGTPITKVVAALVAQGFTPTDEAPPQGLTSPDPETARLRAMAEVSKMIVHGPGPVCATTWMVAWDLDANQRVVRTYGELGGYCL